MTKKPYQRSSMRALLQEALDYEYTTDAELVQFIVDWQNRVDRHFARSKVKRASNKVRQTRNARP